MKSCDKILIRRAAEQDLSGILKIEEEAFVHPWSQESLEGLLSDRNSAVFTAVKDGTVCGYCGVNTVLDEGYITNIAVARQYRRQGIAVALLEELFDFAGEKPLSFLTLEVRKSNLNAINLYLKFGFKQVGERKNYYSEPTENAVLMTKYFKDGVV